MIKDMFRRSGASCRRLGFWPFWRPCGVDGEPEQPTRAMLAPVDLVAAEPRR